MSISQEEQERRKQEDLDFYKSIYLAYVRGPGDNLDGIAAALQGHKAAKDAVKNLQAQRGVIDNSYI